MSVRTVLVDDHAMFLQGLRSLLDSQDEINIVSAVTCGRAAVREAKEKNPDVVVMDVSMPGLNGIEATRLIAREAPSVKVIGLSMHAEEQFVCAVLDAGASAYLLKDSHPEELLRAIRTVMAGKVYLSPEIAGTVVQGYRERGNGDRPSAVRLTDRERQVLQLIAEGHGTKEIAEILGVSPKTVGSHREHIMEKLGIQSIAGLTKYAIRQGITGVARDRQR